MKFNIAKNPLFINEIEYGYDTLGKPFIRFTLEEEAFELERGVKIVKKPIARKLYPLRTLEKIHNREDRKLIIITGARSVIPAIKLFTTNVFKTNPHEDKSKDILGNKENMTNNVLNITNNTLEDKTTSKPAQTSKATQMPPSEITFQMPGNDEISFADSDDSKPNYFEELAKNIRVEEKYDELKQLVPAFQAEKNHMTMTMTHSSLEEDKNARQETIKFQENAPEILKGLSEFTTEIEKNLLVKKSIPSKGKRMEDYEIKETFNDTQANAHKLKFTKKVNPKEHKANKVYLFKEYNGNPVSELEAFESMCYRFELGERTPKVRPLYDKNNTRLGTVVSFYPNLKTMEEFEAEQKRTIKYEDILSGQYADVWFASYNNQESDLHDRNYGMIADDNSGKGEKKSVRYDLDRSNFLVSAAYTDITEDQLKEISKRYKYSSDEIREFPTLSTTTPHYWPGQYAPKDKWIKPAKKNLFWSLHTKKDFNDQKFFAALRRILIPDAQFIAAAEATISSKKLREKAIQQKLKNTRDLTEILVDMSEFASYLKRNPHVIDDIIKGFENTNKDYKNNEYSNLRIDVSAVTKKFSEIQQKIADAGNNKRAIARKA